jgi:hypothetical protein
VIGRALVVAVRGYQRLLSPLLGQRCRFHPTCSQYAIAVIERDGSAIGLWRALGRLLRCHPFHPGGFDPP